ncbi:MAG: hypothetical protein LBK55_01165 [Azoarcus sp.]|nr:hypothetical protein [Azoarcus sp.]
MSAVIFYNTRGRFPSKGDGEPGAETPRRGLRDVAVFVDGIQAARQG